MTDQSELNKTGIKNITLPVLVRYLSFDSNHLWKQSLTHQSFNPEKNNSRYIFLGMYGFKGELCQWIYKQISGDGTHLQHLLGNISSQKYWERLFDAWGLKPHIRCGTNFDWQSHKHIFVAGFLGFVLEHCNEETINHFIYRFFILPNDHLIAQQNFSHDDWAKLLFLCRQHLNVRPKVKYEFNNGLHVVKIKAGNRVLGSHESVSYFYAHKKAIRIALRNLISYLNIKLEADPTHQLVEVILKEKENLKLQAEWKERMDKWISRQALLKERREARRIARIDKAKAEDENRRKLKMALKEKKSKSRQTIYREYTPDEIKLMNPAKRRRLEDLGIITKSR
jgi:hypothetical protein